MEGEKMWKSVLFIQHSIDPGLCYIFCPQLSSSVLTRTVDVGISALFPGETLRLTERCRNLSRATEWGVAVLPVLLRFPQCSLPQRLCSEGELGTPVIWLLRMAKLRRYMAEEEKRRPAGTVSVGPPLSCPGWQSFKSGTQWVHLSSKSERTRTTWAADCAKLGRGAGGSQEEINTRSPPFIFLYQQ